MIAFLLSMAPAPLLVSGVAMQARKQSFDSPTQALLLLAMVLSYFQLFLTNWEQFAIDASSHMEYVHFLLKYHRLPVGSDYAGAAARHPPLFYIATASMLALAQKLQLAAPEQFARHVPMLCYAVFIFMGTRILHSLLHEHRAAYLSALVVFLFWPIGITMGGRISCDIFLYTAQAGSLFALIRWLQQPAPERLVSPFIWGGIAVLAKNGGVFMIALSAIALLRTAFLYRHTPRLLLRYDLLLAINFALLSCVLTFRHGSVLRSIEHVGYFWPYMWDKISHFNLLVFLCDTSLGLTQDSFWNMWLHTLLLGDSAMGWRFPALLILLKLLWMCILLYVISGLLQYRKHMSAWEKSSLALIACFAFIMIAAAIFMLLRTTNANYMDARYAYPVVIGIALAMGTVMKYHTITQQKNLLMLGSVLSGTFALSTCLLILAQQFL